MFEVVADTNTFARNVQMKRALRRERERYVVVWECESATNTLPDLKKVPEQMRGSCRAI
jgi:hypothetical protein